MGDPRIARFAEDPFVSLIADPGEERVLTKQACVWFTPGAHFWSTSVSRVRFGDVEAGLAEVRDLMAARGRDTAAWTIGPSATPGDVGERLLRLGLTEESPAGSAILALSAPPAIRPHSLSARVVASFADHAAAVEVGGAGFDMPAEDRADQRARLRATFEAERAGGSGVRVVVFDGADPIASGRGWFATDGIYLGGGATLPSHRRRGAMGAMIEVFWREAVRRGTPALVTFGSAMAAPGLRTMGFGVLGRVRHLVDRGSRARR